MATGPSTLGPEAAGGDGSCRRPALRIGKEIGIAADGRAASGLRPTRRLETPSVELGQYPAGARKAAGALTAGGGGFLGLAHSRPASIGLVFRVDIVAIEDKPRFEAERVACAEPDGQDVGMFEQALRHIHSRVGGNGKSRSHPRRCSRSGR